MEAIDLLLISFSLFGIVAGSLYILWIMTWTFSHGIVQMLHPLPRLGCCPRCQYDVRTNKTGICPECGNPCDSQSLLHADREASRINAWLATMLCAALLLGLLVYGLVQTSRF